MCGLNIINITEMEFYPSILLWAYYRIKTQVEKNENKRKEWKRRDSAMNIISQVSFIDFLFFWCIIISLQSNYFVTIAHKSVEFTLPDYTLERAVSFCVHLCKIRYSVSVSGHLWISYINNICKSKRNILRHVSVSV